MFAIEFTQSTWFTTIKSIGKVFQKKSWKFFQLTFSLQLTLVNCTWSGPKCNLLSKTCLNVYRHPQYCSSQELVSNYWAVVPQWCPRSLLVSPGDPWCLLFKNNANEKKNEKRGLMAPKTGTNVQKTETESWGLAINEWRPKKSIMHRSNFNYSMYKYSMLCSC